VSNLLSAQVAQDFHGAQCRFSHPTNTVRQLKTLVPTNKITL